MKALWLYLILFAGIGAFAAEVMPPPPARYFNDYARVVSPATADRLNQTLENFERESSDQIVVAVFPRMESDSSIEDYTVRVARAWKVGQQKRNNGAVLFVFVQDHKMRIEVGYGLEGVLPDATCKRIIEEQISPRFRNRDFDGGLTAGVQSMLAAVKGEYRGNGRTVADSSHNRGGSGLIVALIFGAVILAIILSAARRRSSGAGSGWTIGSGGYFGGGWGGGGWSGGGWSGGGGGGGFSGGGGGGGFSGGGGSFGGGGAGGSW